MELNRSSSNQEAAAIALEEIKSEVKRIVPPLTGVHTCRLALA
jgi:hypothetical protein